MGVSGCALCLDDLVDLRIKSELRGCRPEDSPKLVLVGFVSGRVLADEGVQSAIMARL